jgi:hypothetical protein
MGGRETDEMDQPETPTPLVGLEQNLLGIRLMIRKTI